MTRKVVKERAKKLNTFDEYITKFVESRPSEKTKITYYRFFNILAKYTNNESGEHMINNSKDWSLTIVDLKKNLVTEGYSMSTAQTITGMIRGLFKYWSKREKCLPLKLDEQDIKELNKKHRNTKDHLFDKVELQAMYKIANAEEKLVLECLLTGLRTEDCTELLDYGMFREAIEKAKRANEELPYFVSEIDTQKEKGITAQVLMNSDFLETFLSVDTKQAKDSDKLLNCRPIQLTNIVKRLFAKSGLNAHEKIVRAHNVRKYVYSHMLPLSTEYAKSFVGKTVSEADKPYLDLRPENLKELYTKVQSDFILSNGNGTELKNHVNTLEEKLKKEEEENKILKERIKELEQSSSTNFSSTAKNEQDIKKLYEIIGTLQKKGTQ